MVHRLSPFIGYRRSSLRVHRCAFIARGSSLRGSSLRVHRFAFTMWNS
jgi:hypothetical protein